MKKYFVFLFIFSSLSVSELHAQIKAYPSHWWVGMKQNSLQIMLHSSSDLSKSVKEKPVAAVVSKLKTS